MSVHLNFTSEPLDLLNIHILLVILMMMMMAVVRIVMMMVRRSMVMMTHLRKQAKYRACSWKSYEDQR